MPTKAGGNVFVPYQGESVALEYEKIQGKWMTIEIASDWYREYIADDPFQVSILGWGQSFIAWRDLSAKEKKQLWLNWATRNNPRLVISLGLRGLI